MDSKAKFLMTLKKEKLITSIKTPKVFDEFIESDLTIAFLLMGNINNLQTYVKELKRRNKIVFVHLEMVQGIRVDYEGLQFVANQIKPDGIITTKKQILTLAKKLGFLTIQRLFLVDSDAIKNGLDITEKYQPDFIEVMPGLIPYMIKEITQNIDKTLITGGLIHTKDHIQLALDHGAEAVSTSNIKLCKEFLNERKGDV